MQKYFLARLLRLCLFLCIGGVLFFSGCAKPPPPIAPDGFKALTPAEAEKVVKAWGDEQLPFPDVAAAQHAVSMSLDYAAAKGERDTGLRLEGRPVLWTHIHESLEELEALLPDMEREPESLAEDFHWYEMTPESLMTGYYAPLLDASLEPDPAYPYPLYAPPNDLKVLDLGAFHPRWEGQRLIYRIEDDEAKPYHDRKAIDYEGALAGKGLELAWLKDPVEVFFLHIQGSGLIETGNGTRKYALYAGKNGRKYVSLGRELIERELMERDRVSMQAISGFLSDNPDLVPELLSTNPSYVFFRLADDGPFGAFGRILTPKVSVAVDPKRIPLGAALVVQSELPTAGEFGRRDTVPTTFLAFAQDTGGAIKGERLDYYLGVGDAAAEIAGRLKSPSRAWLLLSKRVVEQLLAD